MGSCSRRSRTPPTPTRTSCGSRPCSPGAPAAPPPSPGLEGDPGLRALSLRLFTPVKPMMAEMAVDLQEVLDEHGGETALEYKFDGARIQIHKRGDDVRVFSRPLTDV